MSIINYIEKKRQTKQNPLSLQSTQMFLQTMNMWKLYISVGSYIQLYVVTMLCLWSDNKFRHNKNPTKDSVFTNTDGDVPAVLQRHLFFCRHKSKWELAGGPL